MGAYYPNSGDSTPEGGGLVAELVVGPERKSYVVHERMLYNASPYFQRILERLPTPDEDENSLREILLPDERSDVVEAFLHFLYLRGLPIEMPENGPLVLHVYYFAEKIEYDAMMNATMERIITHHNDPDSTSTWRPITIIGIYQNTRNGSKLRWYITACIVYEMRCNTGSLRFASAYAEIFEVCPELFRDIFVVLCHGMTRMASWDPQATRLEAFTATFTLCDFHYHADGSRCDRNDQRDTSAEVEDAMPAVQNEARDTALESVLQQTIMETVEQSPEIKIEESD
jgi:hypothetical protein